MNLIVGGTGALGSAIAKRLLARGEPVRVMTRVPDKAAGLAAEGAEVVRGDLRARHALQRACQGAEVVVAAAHSIFGRGQATSIHVDGQGHRALIDAAQAAGVRRFVYTSVYTYGPACRAVPFFRIKREVEAYLKASGLPFLILRPTAFMESHVHALLGASIVEKGRAVVFGRGAQPRNFVAAADVAALAVLALSDASPAGQTLEIGGPANHTTMEVVRLYERATGRKAKVTHVPLKVVRAVSTLVRPLHPGLSQVLQAAVLADTMDQSFDAGPLQAEWPVALTRLEDWVAARVNASAGFS